MSETRAHETCAISAIVTAYQRPERTIATLRRLAACNPAPSEILVHVDANQRACAAAVAAALPHLRILVSETCVGPGGGRNKLIGAAQNALVASFDDDSYPYDADFFARAMRLAALFPAAALIGASIFHHGETVPADCQSAAPTASFGAGGALFRKADFLAAGGYVPLAVAYGMEEEDLALRLFDAGKTLLASPWLRVFHDTDLSHHASARVTAGSVTNLALLTWLRYPPAYWPYGALQTLNRIVWCARAGRYAGLLSGIAAIPGQLWAYRRARKPVSLQAMRGRRTARASGATQSFSAGGLA